MAITWTKFPNAQRSVQGVTTALTESAPSSAQDGIDLNSVDSVCITVDPPAGQTFDGTGKLLLHRYSPYLKAWRYLEGYDLDMAGANTKASETFPPLKVDHKNGRLAVIPSGIGVSSGTALTISIEASYAHGGDNQ